MKSPALLLILVLLCFAGCKEDFDLTADYKETPIVYGLLNNRETTHYIRIQKGFLIDGDAYLAAGVTDSVYYADSLTVRLIPYTASNQQQGQIITLHKVTGTLPKDSGIFASAPNVLYSFTGKLDSLKYYKLEVTNTTNGYTFYAPKKTSANSQEGIRLIGDFTINQPNQDFFARGVPVNIFLSSTNPFQISWEPAEGASIYDIKVRFPFKEFDKNTNAFLRDSFIEAYMLKAGTGTSSTSGASVSTSFNTTVFLTTLKNALSVNPDIYRVFDVSKGMTFYFTAGGNELARYINSKNAQNSGLASNEALPPYTNIEGGYGIFDSRYNKQVDSVVLTNSSLDTIACHPLTNGLNFRRANGTFCH